VRDCLRLGIHFHPASCIMMSINNQKKLKNLRLLFQNPPSLHTCRLSSRHATPATSQPSPFPREEGWSHKLHIYLEYHSVCPLVEIGPPPPPPLLQPPPPPPGSPSSDGWRESLVLCLLCGWNTRQYDICCPVKSFFSPYRTELFPVYSVVSHQFSVLRGRHRVKTELYSGWDQATQRMHFIIPTA
jgi:hypothetical protein